MQSLQDWFEAYAESHQNGVNKRIHYLCVPVIYFSIVGLLLCIPNAFFINNFLHLPGFMTNWAFILLLFVLFFYIKLSVKMAIKMMVFSLFCLVLNIEIGKYFNLLYFSIVLFVLAWIGQFYGHKIEGKKPSFLKDLQFLLIGPAWVMENLFFKKKYP